MHLSPVPGLKKNGEKKIKGRAYSSLLTLRPVFHRSQKPIISQESPYFGPSNSEPPGLESNTKKKITLAEAQKTPKATAKRKQTNKQKNRKGGGKKERGRTGLIRSPFPPASAPISWWHSPTSHSSLITAPLLALYPVVVLRCGVKWVC